MSKVKTHQKQILHLGTRLRLPNPSKDATDPIIQVLIRTKKEKCCVIGVNSVYRAILNNNIAFLIASTNVNPPELIDHILMLAEVRNIKVISTYLTPKEIGSKIGTRSTAVAGILHTAPSEILTILEPFSSLLPESNFPHLIVETDIFIPKTKGKKSNPQEQSDK